jgi:anti-anti-sigma factor
MTADRMPDLPPRGIEWTRSPGGVATGRVRGFLDGKGAEALKERTAELPEGSALILNLRDVEYLSSSGIGEIVRLASRFRLVVAEPSEPAMRLLSLAEVLPLFEVVRSEEEARARFA